MSPAPLQCPKPQCRAPLPNGLLNQPDLLPCPKCGTPVQAEVFPALFRVAAPGHGGDLVVVDGESTCFYHPGKKAVRPCEGCGRFVCALCDCELHGQHFCPTCLDIGKRKGKIKSLENHRILHDSIAITLALAPLMVWPITFITAPMAIYWSIRHWNSPRGLIRRGKARYIWAIIFASLEIAGWLIVIFTIFNSHRPSA